MKITHRHKWTWKRAEISRQLYHECACGALVYDRGLTGIYFSSKKSHKEGRIIITPVGKAARGIQRITDETLPSSKFRRTLGPFFGFLLLNEFAVSPEAQMELLTNSLTSLIEDAHPDIRPTVSR